MRAIKFRQQRKSVQGYIPTLANAKDIFLIHTTPTLGIMKKTQRVQNSNPQFCIKFLSLIFGFILLSCSQPAQDASRLDDNRIKEIESAVLKKFDELVTHAEAGDIEKVFSMFDQSGQGNYIDGPWRYRSFQDLLDNYRANWDVVNQDFGQPDVKVIVLSPNFALISSTSNVSSTSKSGKSYKPSPWSMSSIWILKDGQWQIHSFHQFSSERRPEDVK